MMGGIDDNAVWLSLLVLALALPFAIAVVVAVSDLWTRLRHLVVRDRGPLDVSVVTTAVLAAIIVGVVWGGWAAVFAVLLVVLTARLVEVVLDRGATGWRRGAAIARRALLLALVVGIAGALG
jgi:hypothetical protein